MNAKTRKLAMLVAIASTLCSFSSKQTSAQSARGLLVPRRDSAQSANRVCQKLKGSSLSVFDPATGVVTGPVTNAGFLNGTSEDVINFGAGFVFTPDPNVVTYLSDLTITTRHGQLKTSSVTTQSIVTGDGTEWGYINPDTSTGSFAGATGVVFFTFRPVGDDPSVGPYEAELSGEICFAQ